MESPPSNPWMDDLVSANHAFQSEFRHNKVILSFFEYLDLVRQDPQRFMQVTDEMKNLLAKETGGLTKYGTNAMMDTMQEFGGLPTNNFQEVQFDGYDKIDAKAMLKTDDTGHTNLLTNKACFGCTIACGRFAHIRKDHFTIQNRKEYWHASGGLEYETAFAFGPVVGVDDIDDCTFAGYLMNEH